MTTHDQNDGPGSGGEQAEAHRRLDLVALVAGGVSAVIWVLSATGWDGDVGGTGRIAWSLTVIGIGLLMLFRRR